MAEHYSGNKNVIGWQPDNELGNSHDDLCYCGNCRKNFQKWLRKKYGTADELNKAWGTAFWSQEYNSFDEVYTPALTVTGENPSQVLDWKRFHSDLINEFFGMQAEIIREKCPDQFITHNFMGFADTVDYYDLGEQVDFVSHDQYPGGFFVSQPHEDNARLAATLDVVRSYKARSYWIMEQQAGITGWQIMGRAPAPGQLTAWTLQSIAHGADAVVYFRWRTCTMGMEQYWHGILPHSGIPGTRYRELRETVKTVAPLMDKMQGAVPAAETGIVFSFDQLHAFRIQPQHPDLNYVEYVMKYYKALYKRNVPVDFVQSGADLSRYRLIIAPLQYLMTPELEDRYFGYVKNGGCLVLTMRTGVKDEHDICMSDRELPGRLGELAGIRVTDYDCLNQASVNVRYGGRDLAAGKWADIISADKDTCVKGEYAGEFYAGTPCMTENKYGDGRCWYIGTEPGDELADAVTADIIKEAGVHSLGDSDADVELTMKENGNGRWLFAINHTDKEAGYEVPGGFSLIRGKKAGSLGAFEVQILEKTDI